MASEEGVIFQLKCDQYLEIDKSYELDGKLNSNPVFLGNHAYCITDIGLKQGDNDRPGVELYGININTKEIEIKKPMILQKRQRFSSTPGIIENHFYFCTHGNASAIYRVQDGAASQLIWEASRNIFAPILTDWKRTRIYAVDGDGNIVFINATGYKLVKALGTSVRAPMHLGTEHLYVGGQRGDVYQVSLNKPFWKWNYNVTPFYLPQSDSNRILAICTGNDKIFAMDDNGQVAAFNKNGDVDWTWYHRSGEKWSLMTFNHPGLIYLISEQGKVVALSPDKIPKKKNRF